MRGCEDDDNATVGDLGGVVVVRPVHAYVGGTCGSGIVSSAGISMVGEMRGVGGVCEMCMCLVRGCVGGEGASGFRAPTRTVVRMLAPINQLFIDESIVVQI